MHIPNHMIAHRGVFDNKTIPENSMMAFEKALSMKYSIELDVQLTTDNKLVVFHDASLERMTGYNKNLQDCTYSEIQKLHLLKTKATIPTFLEVLDLIQDKVLLDIEIKNTKRIEDTCKILMSQLEGYSNYIIKSFNPRIVRYMKKNYPSIEVGYLIDYRYPNKWFHFFLPSRFMIFYSKADFLAIHKKLLFTKKFQQLKKKYPILLWTIKKDDSYDSDEYILICNDLMKEKDNN